MKRLIAPFSLAIGLCSLYGCGQEQAPPTVSQPDQNQKVGGTTAAASGHDLSVNPNAGAVNKIGSAGK